MSNQIVISPQAERKLRKISKVDQIAIAQKIRSLRNLGVFSQEKLQGYSDIFRVRIGDYRIVYKIYPRMIYIVLIAHRKDVYRLLQEMLG